MAAQLRFPPGPFPEDRIPLPTVNHVTYRLIMSSFVNLLELDEGEFGIYFLSRTKPQLQQIFKDVPEIKNNISPSPAWLQYLSLIICKESGSFTATTRTAIENKIREVDGLSAFLDDKFPNLLIEDQMVILTNRIAWACYYLRQKKNIWIDLRKAVAHFDAVNSSTRDALTEASVGLNDRDSCMQLARDLVEARKTLWTRIRTFIMHRLSASYEDSEDYLRGMLNIAAQEHIADWKELLTYIAEDPKEGEHNKLFPNIPAADDAPTLPEQFEGLKEVWSDTTAVIKAVGNLKDDDRTIQAKQSHALSQQMSQYDSSVDVDSLTTVVEAEACKAKIAQLISSGENLAVQSPGFEIEPVALQGLKSKLTLVLARLDLLQIERKKTETIESQRLSLQSKILSPIHLPKFNDSVDFIEKFVPAFNELMEGKPSELMMKKILEESLANEADRSKARDPELRVNQIYCYLLDKYFNPEVFLPVCSSRLASLPQPKGQNAEQQSVVNIDLFKRIHSHLKRLGRIDVFLTKLKMAELSKNLLTYQHGKEYFKKMVDEPWYKDSHNFFSYLDVPENTSIPSAAEYLEKTENAATLSQHRDFFVNFVLNCGKKLEVELAYQNQMSAYAAAEAAKAVVKNKDKEKGEKKASSYSITANPTGGQPSSTPAGQSVKPDKSQPQIPPCAICGVVHVNSKNGRPNSSLFYCDAFKTYSFAKRLSYVKDNSHCMNCLQIVTGPMNKHKCPDRVACSHILEATGQKCGGKDHSVLLHDYKKHGKIIQPQPVSGTSYAVQVTQSKNAPTGTSSSAPTTSALQVKLIEEVVQRCLSTTTPPAPAPAVPQPGTQSAPTAPPAPEQEQPAGETVISTSHWIDVQKNTNSGISDIYFINQFSKQDNFFASDSRLFSNMIQIECHNLSTGQKVKGVAHLDPGSSRSFVRTSFAKKINAAVIGQDNVSMATLTGIKTEMMQKWKIPIISHSDDGVSTSVITAYGISSIGTASSASPQDHQRLCKEWGVNPSWVSHVDHTAEVDILIGLDFASFLGERVHKIQGKEIPDIFEHLFLKKSPLSKKLFYSGTVQNRLSLNTDTQEVGLTSFQTAVKVFDMDRNKCFDKLGNLTVTQPRVCYHNSGSPSVTDPLFHCQPTEIHLPPALGSGRFVSTKDGNLREILHPKPKVVSCYRVDLSNLLLKPNHILAASADLELFSQLEKTLAAENSLSMTSVLCPAHSMLKCPDCLSLKHQNSWESIQNDQKITENISITPLSDPPPASPGLAVLGQILEPQQYKLSIPYLFSSDISSTHSAENSNYDTAVRSFRFCWNNCQKLNKILASEERGNDFVTRGWLDSVHKDIKLGHLHYLPKELETKGPVIFAGSNVALRNPDHPHAIRNVTNASLAHSSGSFNDNHIQGTTGTAKLLRTLQDFMMHSCPLQTDLKKAYRSCHLTEDTMHILRVVFFDEDVLQGKAEPDLNNLRQLFFSRTQYGLLASGTVLHQCLRVLASLTTEEAVIQFLRDQLYIDDGLTSKAHPQEVVDLAKSLERHLHHYGFGLKTIHSTPEVFPLLEEPDLHTTVLGYVMNYKTDCMTLKANFNISTKKRGLYMSEDLTHDQIDSLPLTLREVARFCSQIFDPIGFLLSSLQACMRSVFSVASNYVSGHLCSDQKRRWNLQIHDQTVLDHCREYFHLTLEVYEKLKPLPRARFPLPSSRLRGIAVFSDASITRCAAVLYLIVEDVLTGKISSARTRAHSKTYAGSVVAGEASSIRLGFDLLEEYLLVQHSIPLPEDGKFHVTVLNDNQAVLYLFDKGRVISDISQRNSVIAAHGSILRLMEAHPQLSVFIRWIESESNLADKLTRTTPENAKADLSDLMRDGPALIREESFPHPEKCVVRVTPGLSGPEFKFDKEVLNHQVRPETTDPDSNVDVSVNSIETKYCSLPRTPSTPPGGVLTPWLPLLSHQHHFEIINEREEEFDTDSGTSDVVYSFACSSAECGVENPHSHRGARGQNHVLDKELYDNLVSKFHSFGKLIQTLSSVLKYFNILRNKARGQSDPDLSPGYWLWVAFNTLCRTSQHHYPISSKATAGYETWSHGGIQFALQRFHSYVLGPRYCKKRNVPLLSAADPLSKMILRDSHLVNTTLDSSMGTLHLGVKAALNNSRTGRYGVLVLSSERLMREIIKNCVSCRRTAPVTSEATSQRSHWWSRVLEVEDKRAVGKLFALDILGPFSVHPNVTQSRSTRAPASSVWAVLALDISSRYLTFSLMRDYSASAFVSGLRKCLQSLGTEHPVAFVVDSGSQIFPGGLDEKLKAVFGHVHLLRAPRESQFLNSLIERRIQELKRLVRSFSVSLPHEKSNALNVFTLEALLSKVMFELNRTPLPGRLTVGYFPLCPVDIVLPLHSKARHQTLRGLTSDCLSEDEALSPDTTTLYHTLLHGAWESILAHPPAGLARTRSGEGYLCGDIVLLVYPSSKSGKCRYGIIIKKINTHKYFVQFLVRKAADMSTFTIGTMPLSPRLFRLLYRPDPVKDQSFLKTWQLFCQSLPLPAVPTERQRDVDDQAAKQQFEIPLLSKDCQGFRFPPAQLPTPAQSSMIGSKSKKNKPLNLTPENLDTLQGPPSALEQDISSLAQEDFLASEIDVECYFIDNSNSQPQLSSTEAHPYSWWRPRDFW